MLRNMQPELFRKVKRMLRIVNILSSVNKIMGILVLFFNNHWQLICGKMSKDKYKTTDNINYAFL